LYEYRQVIVQMRLGQSDRQIAKAQLMGRNKAAGLRELAEQQGWLDPARPLPSDGEIAATIKAMGRPSAPRPQATSLVGPYAETVTTWWQKGIQATTIFQALRRTHGFSGSYSSVRRFVQGLAKEHPQTTTILDFDVADAVQVDFGAGPKMVEPRTGKLAPTWVFVMTLCWSRHQYAEIVFDQRVATWLACHRRAFEHFGGVPRRVIIDNLKSAITRACHREPDVQRSYAEFAEGYGFLIAPCPPRDPQKKGRVEAGVKYVKRAFFPLRDFRDVHDGNRQLMDWVMGEAGNRIHGTTFEAPLKLFVETERAMLRPLPDVRPELAMWAKGKLHPNCHVAFEKCRYSAPFRLVGRDLWLRVTAQTVQIYYDHELVAIHPYLPRPGMRSTVDDHLPPDALAYKMQGPQWCVQQADEIGPRCRAVIDCLFSSRVMDNLNAAQGIVALARRFGKTRVEAACDRALCYGTPYYRSVKQILERGLDQAGATSVPPASQSDVYAGKGVFCRDHRSLLVH
jgi:transposase